MNTVASDRASIPFLFEKALGRPLERLVSLRDYSNFRIGGPADFFFAPSSADELQTCVRLAQNHSLPFYVIGAGTNILFDDKGFRGLIIKSEVRGIKKGKEGMIEVFSGTALADLVEFALNESLQGLEFAAGIPGTVGGAVFGNAGAFGRCIGEVLEEAVLITQNGGRLRVGKAHLDFGYRYSSLKREHWTLVEAFFRLEKGDREKIKAGIEENLERRKSRHPSIKTAYAGSYFKNPVLVDGTKASAGFLLDKVGAKGMRVGGAAVYPGHANFIINLGQATAADVLELARLLKERVKAGFGVELEEEVIYLPANFSMP